MRRLLLPFLAVALFAGSMQSLAVLFLGHGRRPAPWPSSPVPPRLVRQEPGPLAPADVQPPREPDRIPPRSYPASEQSIVINEVEYHAPSDDPLEEWIELHNRGDAPVDVSGWKLAEGVDFTIPPGTTMAPGSYLVCAADRERVRAAAGIECIGNWTGTLKDSGEKIRLVTADGKDADDLDYEDGPPLPALADGRGATLERRNPHVPSSLPANWGPASAGGWVRVQARGRPSTNRLYLYLDGPGVVYVDDVVLVAEGDDPTANLIPDGGFEEGAAFWRADGNHSRSSVTRELARSGRRSLAVRASGAGSTRGTSVMATIPGLARDRVHELSFWACFSNPAVPLTARFSGSREGGGIYAVAVPRGGTPGRPNSIGAQHPPPTLYPLEHAPARPSPADTVVVTASATSFLPVRSVELIFDAGRGEERARLVPSAPLDATGGARQIPCSARIGPFPPGTLVRYRAVIEDDSGAKGAFPPAGEGPTSLAFFVEDPGRIEPATPGVPVYHFLLDPEVIVDLERNVHSDTYRSGNFMGEGKVHCDVGFRYRGQTSRWLPKKHWKVQFQTGGGLRGPVPPNARFRTINLNSGYGDKSFLREMLGFQLWRDMGEAYCETWHARAYLNGSYLGLYIAIENPNGDFLERNRLREGWLWKSYSTGHSLDGGFELEEGDPTSGAAMLASFLEGINDLEGESLEAFIRERVNVDSFVNYLAGCQLIHQADAVAKNYLLYADPEGKFTMYPWDLDLTHGRNYECSGGGIWNDTIRHDMWERETGDSDLLYGTRANPKCGDSWNAIIDAFLVKTHAFRPLYYKKLSEHLAHFYHPDVLVPRIEELRAQLREEVARDRDRWGAYGGEVDFDKQCDILIRWVRLRFKHLAARLAKLGYPVGSAFSARFESPERVGTAPFTARFRSACVGKAESLEWDFGDGTKGTGEAPEHIYEKPGTYDVRLGAKGPEGEHEIVRRDWVRVKDASR